MKVHVKVSRTYSCLQTNRRRWTSNIPLELLVDSCIFSPSLMHQQGSGFLIGQTKWMSKLVQSKAALLKSIKKLESKSTYTLYARGSQTVVSDLNVNINVELVYLFFNKC